MSKQIIIRQRLRVNRKLSDYGILVPKAEISRIKSDAKKIGKNKIIYLNSTPNGGGVAELLKNIIPLQKSLGLDVEWYALSENKKFFEISKKLHNSLQGSNLKLTDAEKDYYLSYNAELAEAVEKISPDMLMIQDQQPLGMLLGLSEDIKVASRIHIDMTKPNPDSLSFIWPFLTRSDKLIFTLKKFVPKGVKNSQLFISPPAIDPLARKNIELTEKQVAAVAESIGIDRSKPIMSQVSRFDKWKDPIGVLQAYHLVKEDYPDTQLILMGIMEAQDDPEAADMLKMTRDYAGTDAGVMLISDISQLQGINLETFVNAVQRMSDVVLQKSVREGFGLTVAEAMWKQRPVIGGNVGGIKIQIVHGVNGFLVQSPKQAAKYAVELISNKKLSARLGLSARKMVSEKFLITRYLHDEIRIMKSLADLK